MFLHHPNGQRFEAKAQEEAVRRVLEAQDVALGDLMKSMDRHRYQTKAEMAGVFFFCWFVAIFLPWIWKLRVDTLALDGF